MRQKYLGVVVLMMAAFALAACRGNERSSLTGGYGSGVVSGQVIMSESGASPAGVEVSVRGSGQSVTLGADGRFAFAGLSDDVTLEFRRADGVNAALRLDQLGDVTVELTQTTAKKASGRRRSVGGGGTKVQQFEGLIRTAGAEEIVVYTSHKEEVTIALGTQTIIRKGNTTLTPADLTVDMRVHVKAQQTDGKWTALLVIVQNDGTDDDDGDDDQPAVREYEGIVVSASATELVIFDSHKREVTFVINGDTVIRKGNTPVLPADILAGWRVHVKATASEDGTTNTATRVTIQNTNVPIEIEGEVTAVGASQLTVEDDGTSYTVLVTNSTQIREKGKKVSLSTIAAGDTVKVEGTRTGATTISAKSIELKSE